MDNRDYRAKHIPICRVRYKTIATPPVIETVGFLVPVSSPNTRNSAPQGRIELHRMMVRRMRYYGDDDDEHGVGTTGTVVR